MVHLTMTDVQARVVSTALEMWSRALMGQLNIVVSEVARIVVWKDDVERRLPNYKAIRESLEIPMDEIFGLHVGAAYAISSEETPESARVAYDVHQVMRHALAWHRDPKGGGHVHFHQPMNYAEEPLPTCKVMDVIEALADLAKGGDDAEED